MKTTLFIILIIFTFSIAWSQEETLVGENVENGGYGGLVWKLTSIKGSSTIMAGARGGWIIDHIFAIGGGGYSTISDIQADLLNENNDPLYIILDYAGVELEYIHNSDKLVHWTFHTLLGGGEIRLTEHNADDKIASDNLWVIEPSLDIDLNIAKWFRLGMGVSYRIVTGVDGDLVSSSDVSGANGLLILKFGKF